MIKIESLTLEEAYTDAASSLKCSVTELKIEVVQYPKKGILGLFKKNAIIIAVKQDDETKSEDKVTSVPTQDKPAVKQEAVKKKKEQVNQESDNKKEKVKEKTETKSKKESHTILNDTIMPASFVSTQDDEDDMNYEPVYADEHYDEDEDESHNDITDISQNIQKEINSLFDLTCFNIDKIDVSVYDENTLLIEFKGEDAALLIGKEGYRYKALSYMIFNWINTKYQVQLRLEIAEFLKNQEESVSRYLQGVCESVDRDGRAQTKILDGVLVQIALKELRDIYPDKYVAIRSTRDGMKYIIINDYHNN